MGGGPGHFGQSYTKYYPATVKNIREVCEIYYWDLQTLNNAKPYFFLNEMNKNDLLAMYSTAFWCLSFYWFFWLYCVTTVTPFIEWSEGWSLRSGRVLDQSSRSLREEEEVSLLGWSWKIWSGFEFWRKKRPSCCDWSRTPTDRSEQPSLRSMKGVTVIMQWRQKKNSKTTNRHQNAVEYIASKSFLFISFKKK